jgi:hypothetical protein
MSFSIPTTPKISAAVMSFSIPAPRAGDICGGGGREWCGRGARSSVRRRRRGREEHVSSLRRGTPFAVKNSKAVKRDARNQTPYLWMLFQRTSVAVVTIANISRNKIAFANLTEQETTSRPARTRRQLVRRHRRDGLSPPRRAVRLARRQVVAAGLSWPPWTPPQWPNGIALLST